MKYWLTLFWHIYILTQEGGERIHLNKGNESTVVATVGLETACSIARAAAASTELTKELLARMRYCCPPLFPLFLEAVFPNCVEEDNTSDNDGKIALCPLMIVDSIWINTEFLLPTSRWVALGLDIQADTSDWPREIIARF